MCIAYMYFCKCCKREMGDWKKSKSCLNEKKIKHRITICTKFREAYCENCLTQYLATRVMHCYDDVRKEVVTEELVTFDRYKLPKYLMSNIPKRPDVKLLVKNMDGSEIVVKK